MKVLIAGLGLIGGSFALALRDHGLTEEILGVERSPEIAQEALALGLADRIVGFEEGISEADLIVLATPVDTLPLLAIKALNRIEPRQTAPIKRRGRKAGASLPPVSAAVTAHHKSCPRCT